MLRTNPFTGLLIVQPGYLPGTPLLVREADVDRVQELLDDPRTAHRMRDVEFQMSSESYDIGGGEKIRAMYLVDREAILSGDQLTDALAASDPDPGREAGRSISRWAAAGRASSPR